jgi:hypothetical protein
LARLGYHAVANQLLDFLVRNPQELAQDVAVVLAQAGRRPAAVAWVQRRSSRAIYAGLPDVAISGDNMLPPLAQVGLDRSSRRPEATNGRRPG